MRGREAAKRGRNGGPPDSLAALADHHYPWAPVRLLLRHLIETAELLGRVDAATPVITAERDTIVPATRSRPGYRSGPALGELGVRSRHGTQ